MSILTTLLLLIYVFPKNSNEAPYFLLMFGILYFLRAIFIVLTPLGNPGIGNNPLFTGPTFLAGLYFSGHTAETFLAFLLVKKRAFKIIFLTILFLIMFFLLVARGHYSIDIWAGIIFAYAIYSFGQKHLRKHFVIK
ncbi:MAG: phosphatase PAP2-related protein [Candidatus Pacearchaeota archaeon]